MLIIVAISIANYCIDLGHVLHFTIAGQRIVSSITFLNSTDFVNKPWGSPNVKLRLNYIVFLYIQPNSKQSRKPLRRHYP